MRKYKTLVTLIFLGFFSSISFAQTVRKINDFDTRFVVNLDGTVYVSEKILFNFGTNIGHGIIRKIGYKITNNDGKRFKADISDISVTDESNKNINFVQTDSGETLDLKIGDADKTVTGTNTYIINYKLSGALRYFDDHDELYWSPTGNNWDVSILKTTTQITLPDVIKQNVNAICYTGATGSTAQNCSFIIDNNVIEIVTADELAPNEGVTLAISFPKNIVAKLEPQKDEPSLLETLIILLIAILVALVSLFWYVILPIRVFVNWWHIYKKDKNAQVVAAWFEAPKNVKKIILSPAETSCVVDNNVDHKDVSATVIDLAQRGFVKIVEDTPKDFRLILQKDYKNDVTIRDFEKLLLTALFNSGSTVAIADLKDSITFSNKITKFKETVSQELVSGGIYKDSPEKVNTKYVAVGVFAFMTFNFILALIVFLFGRKSAAKTDYGVKVLGVAKSLKNFLVSQDDQLDFQAKNQMFFEKLLPYATAFGAEKVWVKRFEGLQFVKPDWYEGQTANGFMYSGFVSSFDHSFRGVMTANSSNGSSSGFSGGFSGGGGGGGGGGSSW